jgi:Cu(I)-responsive transcriptional regulator
MNIGDASERSGLPAKTIRYYEDIGLLKPGRSENGYRDYSMSDVHRLKFLQRSRSLGFSVEECRQLLSLYGDTHRESADVKAIAEVKLAEIDRKIAELESLRETLRHLVRNCHGDARPECPIIDELAGKQQATTSCGGASRAQDDIFLSKH